MEKALLIKSLFFFVSIWGLAVIFLWFRPSIEIFWKIIGTIIFCFYVWFFYEEIIKGYNSFSASWYTLTIDFLKELLTITFTNLFFLWPLVLIIIFYKADDIGAEKLLKFMCIFTLVIWVLFIIYTFYNQGIDQFFYKNLKKMIPNAK